MNPICRSLAPLACAIPLVFAVAPAWSVEEAALPPEKPTTPYEAEVRNTYDIRTPGGGSSGGDTLEIRVSAGRLYERPKIMGETTAIVDTEKKFVIEFATKGTDKVAAKFALNDAPIPYVGGRAALAAFEPAWPAPKVVGEDKVAGQKCTKLEYGEPAENGIAACVSKEGVVMRAKIKFPDYEREFELLEFDAGEQDEKWFTLPKDFTVQDNTTAEPAP